MARIAIVGSVASDEVVRLEERMREGAHLNGRLEGVRLGGGGANTAVALASAGHSVHLVSAVGDDEAGAWQLARLVAAGVDAGPVVRVPGPSTRSILHIDPAGERTIVNLGRAKETAPPARLLGLNADIVYVRTRAVGLAPLLTEKAREATVIAHVPPVVAGAFPAHVVLGSASDLDGGFLADPVAAARAVAGDLLRWVVITRGADGVEAWTVTGERLFVPAPKVRATDSTGAGDAFAAGLCHALAAGAPMARALPVAVLWGAEKVRNEGSALAPDVVARLLGAER
ncbi:MAG: PfkB family carbohydrate kinase [Magnetospirillum sp.]|nr:PfkB family carbohydrate kinase [Magnetospirillum sp.]